MLARILLPSQISISNMIISTFTTSHSSRIMENATIKDQRQNNINKSTIAYKIINPHSQNRPHSQTRLPQHNS